MTITKVIKKGDYAPDLLKDDEAVKDLSADISKIVKNEITDSLKTYHRVLTKCKHLRPNGEAISIQITIEAGDSIDFVKR